MQIDSILQFLQDHIPTMEQLIQLLDVIIWPSLLFLVILLLREPIKALLPLVEDISYKDFKIRFREGLDQTAEELNNAGVELPTETADDSKSYQLIETLPQAAILESWKELESAAREKIKELAPYDPEYKNLMQRPISYLEYTGALTPSTSRAIRELRSLRNKTVHSTNVKITKNDAKEYHSLAKAITTQIVAIRELPKIKLSALTSIITELNHLIDSGKYNEITIDDVHTVIKRNEIIPFLTETTKGDSDFSIFGDKGPYANFVRYYHEQMHQMYDGYAGNERRKWGIENYGLCILLAWTNEIIQHGAGWYPNDQ